MHIQWKASPREGVGVNRAGGLLIWLLLFFFLDICTTVVGIAVGFRELNPVVSSMLRLTGLRGLLLSKALGVMLAGYFIYSGRLRLLRRVTVVMGAVVGWNLFWLMTR